MVHSLFIYNIFLKENFRSSVDNQQKLNPNMKEMIRAKVLKLRDTAIIYPIIDNAWISPVQLLPKNGGTTVV